VRIDGQTDRQKDAERKRETDGQRNRELAEKKKKLGEANNYFSQPY